MKIAVIIGAGKVNGNTDQLCASFIKGLEEAGHQVSRFHLGEMKVGPCTGCNSCRQTGTCLQKDDFDRVLEGFLSCDLLVLATPLYFWNISAQLKAFIDRIYCIGEKDEKGFYFKYPAKKVMLLATCADISSHFYAFEMVDAYYNRLVRYMRWEDCGKYYATGCGGSSMPRRIEETRHLSAVYELGRSI